MVYLELESKLWIKINADDIHLFNKIKDRFSFFVDGYYFTPQYKAGNWDGKIHLLKGQKLPYGLLFDLVKFLKKQKVEIKLSDEVKELFGNGITDVSYNLSLTPRGYQKDIAEACLQIKKSIMCASTGSGKSFSIALILDNLIKSNLTSKTLIIVPTTSLILQFYDDLVEYGIDENLLGKFYADEKEWDNPVLISTWQSLTHDNEKLRRSEVKKLKKELAKKNIKKEEQEKAKARYDFIRSREHIENVQELMQTRQQLLDSVDAFFVDECQVLRSDQTSALMQKMSNAEYRFACTGTLPRSKLDRANILSFIGPVVRHYTVKDLTDKGYLNPCLIKQYKIYYKQKMLGALNEVKNMLFESEYRQSIINGIVKENKGHNILFLVNRIEKEGRVLEENLKEQFPNYQIKYIHGKTKPAEREEWRKKCNEENDVLLLATYSLFQSGINIPNLSRIVLTSSFKGEVRILQSIGRSLRKPDNKKSSIIFDLADQVKHVKKHGKVRRDIYSDEEFDVEEIKFVET